MLLLSFSLPFFFLSSLFGLIHCDEFISPPFESVLNPDVLMKNCTINENCADSINSTSVHYYAVQYSFNPNMTIRVTTNMTYNQSQVAPILVVVRQIGGIISWELPYELSNGMLYSTVSRVLCPYDEVNRTRPHTSTIFIEISTSNPELIDYSIRLDNVSSYVLNPDTEQELSISPSMPMYYKVLFPPEKSNILITVSSPDGLCAVVSVQSLNCPVYDVGEIGVKQGHYQTMSKSASLNVYHKELTKDDQFLLVFVVKPTNAECLDYRESTDIQPAGILDIPRTKTIKVTLHSPASINPLHAAIGVTLAVYLLIYLIASVLMCTYHDIYDDFSEDNRPFIAPIEHELSDHPFPESRTRTPDGEENVAASTRSELSEEPFTVQALTTSSRGFVTVSDLCVKEYGHLQQKFRIYPTTVVTVAIFYSLPVIQLVLQYQINIDSIGNEDICYFNFLCTRELFSFTVFNNILSNFGYCALGILFIIIVYRRDRAYTRFITREARFAHEYGVPQHFGVFYAMGIGLFMEGVMSACYHVCPSKQNFQFDTSFMFIITVLNIIKIYQTRHADVNPHSAGTFAFLAVMIFITVIGVYYDQLGFWIFYAIIHITICLIFTAKIYYMGRLKLSKKIHIHLYRLVRENGFCSRPRYLNRMVLLVLGNSLNIGFALYGAINQPESFPNHLLFIFMGNLGLYLIYYAIMKMIHRERFTRFVISFLILAMLFWIPSIYFFFNEVKSYEVQPALSREMNHKCVILDTYDYHDIWHLLSSFALFFSFLSLLTIDDGVRIKRRKELAAF